MNYAESRKRAESDLWDWTIKNDGVIHPAGSCANRECQHGSQEEADRHFYEWSLEQVKEHAISHAEKCEVCGIWTDKWLGNSQLSLYSFQTFLCDAHRTKEQLTQLRPFKSPIVMMHS